MSLANFSTDLFVVTVNLRTITDWGETATPFTDAPLNAKSQLRQGQGKRAVRLNRSAPGRSVSMFLNPGSPDSAFLQGLFNSNADITITKTQIGTLEAAIGTEGVLINDGTVGRGGATISDDQFDFQLNLWTATKGGE